MRAIINVPKEVKKLKICQEQNKYTDNLYDCRKLYPKASWHGKEVEYFGSAFPSKKDKWRPYSAFRWDNSPPYTYCIISTKNLIIKK